MTEEPPQDFVGKRAWWLIQILACVPPSYWQSRFGIPPASLIQAAQQNDQWKSIIIDGWSRAATGFRDPQWASQLWKWAFAASAPTSTHHRTFINDMYWLRDILDRSLADQLLMQHLQGLSVEDYRWVATMQSLPAPWSVEIGIFYISEIRRQYSDVIIQSDGSCSWFSTLPNAALALPSQCFAQALQEWLPRDLEDVNLSRWHRSHWERSVPRFMETIRFRQRVMKEIPL
jgi:hypothetical protein